MDFCVDNGFILTEVPENFAVFCQAELPEIGEIFSLAAPSLECGITLAVHPDGSIAYTVAGFSDFTFTVSLFPPAFVRTGTVRCKKSSARRVPVQNFPAMVFRKSTFLRL